MVIRSEYGNNDGYSSSEQAEEEIRGRKRPANVMKGADTNFLYAESKAARLEPFSYLFTIAIVMIGYVYLKYSVS